MSKTLFGFPDLNHPSLIELKRLTKLKVNYNGNVFENAYIILGYVHNLFSHNGDNQPTALDPITILSEAKAGKKFRCVEYSLLAMALLWAYEIPARVIGLKTKDVETREYGAGHVVIEYWDDELRKWVMCDVQFGLIPAKHNNLLSVYELREEIKLNNKLQFVTVKESRFPNKSYPNMHSYIEWVKDYLYFIDTPKNITFLDLNLSKQEIVMLVPKNIKHPLMFQGLFKMNAIYTENVKDFYINPSPSTLKFHKDLDVFYFKTQKEFHNWLSKNYNREKGFWLHIYKKASKIPTVLYSEAVDEALCFGWIDGLTNSLDEESYLVRFTPRRPKSVWSKINVANVERLIACGSMQPSGLKHIENAKADGRWEKAY